MADAFPTAVYLLCFATSAACAWLLARNFLRTRARLLLWSAICFGLLAGNNLFVIVDLVLVDDMSFQLLRILFSIAAAAVLLIGFIWDIED